jgi:hypothetical protein
LKRLLKILLGLSALFAGLLLIKPKPKTIIFGHFASECTGNCGTMYKVSYKVIVRDTTSFFQNKSDLSKFAVKFQNGSEQDDEGNFDSFKLNIPLLMLLDPRSQFGCPDCHDQGGYYLQVTMLGVTRRFQIDKGHEPFYYPELTRDIDHKIEDVITELKQYGR